MFGTRWRTECLKGCPTCFGYDTHHAILTGFHLACLRSMITMLAGLMIMFLDVGLRLAKCPARMEQEDQQAVAECGWR